MHVFDWYKQETQEKCWQLLNWISLLDNYMVGTELSKAAFQTSEVFGLNIWFWKFSDLN